MQKNTIVITSIARTPQGNLLGSLKNVTATELGAIVIRACVERAKLSPAQIPEVFMGSVLPAGLGQAPARQAALKAGLSISTQCTTLNKVCGSGMKAIMTAHDSLRLGNHAMTIAGGMESMTNAPYLALKARQGYRLGHSTFYDHMMLDGLEDAYEQKPMGFFAEQCAKHYGFTRDEQDAYAVRSLERAQKANREQLFANEIVPVIIQEKTGDSQITQDEHPFSVSIDKVKKLQPAFMKEGTITAANSSSIADGAAAVSLMTLTQAEKSGIKPLATLLAHSAHAKAPAEFPTAPIQAIQHLLKKINWTVDSVDLFEINEAFAVVPMAAMRDLNIPIDKLNIHGGGCALGHPIGATGARIVVTLVAALNHYQLKRGIAALCIGGGEATAIAVERFT